MSFDPMSNSQERRAGLLGQRFKRAAEEGTPWYGPDIRVVDASSEKVIQAADVGPVQPVWETEPTIEDQPPAPLFAMPAPTGHAQALWNIIPLSTSQTEPGVLEHHLAAALYPAQPAAFSWKRLLQGRTGQNKRMPEVLALEITGDQKQVRFLLRGSITVVTRVFDHLLLSYGALQREALETEVPEDQDPLTAHSGEAISLVELILEQPSVIPLKTTGVAQGVDPLLGVLYACGGAIADSPIPLRVVSQLVLTQAPANWSKKHQALLERLRRQRATPPGTRSSSEIQQIALAALLLSAMLLFFLATHGLLFLLWGLLLPLLVLGGSVGLARLWRRWLLGLGMLRHEQEVAIKLAQGVAQTCLRLYVLGPADAPLAREAALDRLIAAYGAYKGGNGWRVGKRSQIGSAVIAHPGLARMGTAGELFGQTFQQASEEYQAVRDPALAFQAHSFKQRLLLWLEGDQKRPMLSMQEIAALWHLPSSKRLSQQPSDRGTA